MSVVADTGLIAPHGGALVERAGERPDGLEGLETITLTPREVSDLDMLASVLRAQGEIPPCPPFRGPSTTRARITRVKNGG